MRRSLSLPLLSVCCIALTGCPTPPAVDAGQDAPMADAPMLDVPRADAPMLDTPPTGDVETRDASIDARSCVCDADETCLRGVCVATCAGLDGVEAALAPGVVPLTHTCRSPSVFDVVGSDVYELEAVPSSSGVTLRLVRWAATGGAVTPTTLASRTYVPTSDPPEMVFPGYVAVSENEAHALFGYTTTLGGFVGGVVDVDTTAMTFEEISAPGNFDAAFLGGPNYAVNGLGFASLTGQGLYRASAADTAPAGVRAVTGMGDASGSVALWEEENLVVFGGANYGGPWPDGSTGGYVFFLPLGDVTTTATAIDAFVVARRLVLPGAFELLTGGRLLEIYYGGAGIDGMRYFPLTRDPGTGAVTAGAAADISTGGTFYGAGAVEDGVLLIHAGGALWVSLP